MKTFKDLEFKDKYSKMDGDWGKQARMDFDNDYGVSVITGAGSYSNPENPYELAVFYKGRLTYSTEITDDVIGYCDEDEITRLMKKVQELDSTRKKIETWQEFEKYAKEGMTIDYIANYNEHLKRKILYVDRHWWAAELGSNELILKVETLFDKEIIKDVYLHIPQDEELFTNRDDDKIFTDKRIVMRLRSALGISTEQAKDVEQIIKDVHITMEDGIILPIEDVTTTDGKGAAIPIPDGIEVYGYRYYDLIHYKDMNLFYENHIEFGCVKPLNSIEYTHLIPNIGDLEVGRCYVDAAEIERMGELRGDLQFSDFEIFTGDELLFINSKGDLLIPDWQPFIINTDYYKPVTEQEAIEHGYDVS